MLFPPIPEPVGDSPDKNQGTGFPLWKRGTKGDLIGISGCPLIMFEKT
jgi:hypothetical protein